MAAEPKESKRAIALVENAANAAAATATQAPAAMAAQAPTALAVQAHAGAASVAAAAPGAAQAKTIMDNGAVPTRAAMEKGMEQMTKTAEGFFKAAEEAAEFGRGNIEAMTKSAQLFAVGFQDMGKQVFAVTQALTDHALESAKALAAVKSLKEAADIQASFAKASMERSMSEAAKLQEAAFRLTEQAYAPLTARMTLAVEKFGKPIAA